jgi:ribose 5-phosphate isomerase B
MMKIAVATDHAGFPLKATVLDAIRCAGHEPVDFGTNTLDSVDYADFVEKAGKALQSGEAERAIVVCGSGVGAAITANKMKGVYACVCHDTYSAHQGVEHDNMNCLALGGRIIGDALACEIVTAFLGAHFQADEPRHVRRVGKTRAIEQREL